MECVPGFTPPPLRHTRVRGRATSRLLHTRLSVSRTSVPDVHFVVGVSQGSDSSGTEQKITCYKPFKLRVLIQQYLSTWKNLLNGTLKSREKSIDYVLRFSLRRSGESSPRGAGVGSVCGLRSESSSRDTGVSSVCGLRSLVVLQGSRDFHDRRSH